MQPIPFGRYLLLEQLAQGGMATVYRAVLRGGPGFQKPAALKRVLRALSEDPEFVARFADEARIASTLAHGNIVQVFDFGKVEGEYFLAMELVDGPDLGTLVEAAQRRGQPIPIPAALFVCAALARGLGAAHRRTDEWGQPAPVVHRDVSPQNVLVSRAGEVKVADFGIAKAADKVLRTRTGLVLGKCRYMAPEQAAGEGVTPRTDVFATGCVLFELLTDRPVFEGEGPEAILRAVVGQPIPVASTVNPEIPPELDEILTRAMNRVAAARYPDGDALARDLERLLHTIAPEYSRDDLSALVTALAPARRETRRTGEAEPRPAAPGPTPSAEGPSLDALRAGFGQAPTVPQAVPEPATRPMPSSPLASLATSTASPTHPRAAPPPPSPTDAALLPFATTRLLDRGSDVSQPSMPSVPSVRTGPAAIQAVTERAALDAPPRLSRTLRWALLSAAAAAGLLVGVALRRGMAAPDDAGHSVWVPGTSLEGGPWRLRLRSAQRGRGGRSSGSMVWVELDVEHAKGTAGDAGRYFFLGRAGDPGKSPRVYRIPSGPGEAWTLGFDGAAEATPALEFVPPDAAPLRRRLPL